MSRKSLICLFIITIASIHAAPSKFSKTHLSHERIVGGYELNITEVPWQASLQMEGVRHFCGGSIIGQQWILTAAHCVTEYEEDSTPLRVLVGITHKEKNVPSLKTAKVFVHPSYDEESTDYDFALIRLTEKINYNEKVNSIKLPDINDTDLAAGTLCLISGWGNTQNPNESPVRLRGAKVPLVEHDLCNEAYDGIVTPRMICAGDYEHGGKDACQGDSGGPLVSFDTATKEPTLIGIVSWGKGCAEEKYPGVYSKVLAEREWIHSISNI